VLDFKDYLGLGIAGNFALHLAQAGELEDFKEIITEDEAAPKGIFPFYLPKEANTPPFAKEQLFTYPLSHDTISLPQESLNVQAEPEVALLCDLRYQEGKLIEINPSHFGAYNDCSIRVAGASKISDKKNWGTHSKGLSQTLLSIDSFCSGGVMDNFSICSFLERDGELHPYGEDVALTGYSYFYETLQEWIIKQINTQEDFGPLEAVNEYIKNLHYPKKMIISIGATRYSEYGEKTFLEVGDTVFVVVYKNTRYSLEQITTMLQTKEFFTEDISILSQKVS